MKTRPSQKTGIDTPRSETVIVTASVGEPRRVAATVPSGTPNKRPTSMAAMANSTVAGKRTASSAATGRLLKMDRPRSPRAASRT
jgi:hypothetical protein